MSVAALPLVSIGLPVFNGSPYLPGALDALLGQTYPHTEIVISDNCSTDDTGAIAESYCRRHPRIRYSRNESNLGVEFNWRRVVELARGEFFMWAAHDDLWEPDFVSAIVDGLRSDPDYVTGFCQFLKFHHADGRRERNPRNPPYFGSDRAQNQLTYLTTPCYWLIYGVHRTEAMRRIMSMHPTQDAYGLFFDYYIPFQLLGMGKPYIARRPLFLHGKRSDQISSGFRTRTKRELLATWRALILVLATSIAFHPTASLRQRWAMFRVLLGRRAKLKQKPYFQNAP